MIKLKGITWDHARGYDPLIASSELYFKEKGIQVDWQKRSLTNFGDQSLEELSKQGFATESKKHNFNLPQISSIEIKSIVASLQEMKAELKNRIVNID
jgi:hypothetical protein